MLSRNCNQKHVGVGRIINMINGSVSVITIWTYPFGNTRAEGRSGERRGGQGGKVEALGDVRWAVRAGWESLEAAKD